MKITVNQHYPQLYSPSEVKKIKTVSFKLYGFNEETAISAAADTAKIMGAKHRILSIEESDEGTVTEVEFFDYPEPVEFNKEV